MRFLSFSEHSDLAVAKYNHPTWDDSFFSTAIIYQKEKASNLEVLLISKGGFEYRPGQLANSDRKMVSELHQAWSIFNTPNPDVDLITQSCSVLDHYGEQLSIKQEYWGFRVRRLKNNPAYNQFFILLNQDDPEGIPLHAVRILCNLAQVEAGRTPLHASCILHSHELYLFSGPSGAGKSTIASLSKSMGDEVLDEDQIMIYRRPDGRFSANAWGYNLRESALPIKAFFRIVKSKKDELIPLQKSRAAHLIAEQSLEITGTCLPEQGLIDLFSRTAELARSIPCYELHFRKSSDFWRVIDSQLSQR